VAIYKGDIGLAITLDLGESIAAATALKIHYKKPSGTTGTWTAVLSGTTALAYTTTAASDIDEGGSWQLQAAFTLSGWTGHSTIATMAVSEPLV
jgi:hypothetical protein